MASNVLHIKTCLSMFYMRKEYKRCNVTFAKLIILCLLATTDSNKHNILLYLTPYDYKIHTYVRTYVRFHLCKFTHY